MRRNQILAWAMSASEPGKNYEVALEVDAQGQPLTWLTGPGVGMPRVHCECRSMRNRTGTDERGNCKHIRAVIGYQSKDPSKNSRSASIQVHDVAALTIVRNWQRPGTAREAS